MKKVINNREGLLQRVESTIEHPDIICESEYNKQFNYYFKKVDDNNLIMVTVAFKDNEGDVVSFEVLHKEYVEIIINKARNNKRILLES